MDNIERINGLLSTINGGALEAAKTGRCGGCGGVTWEQDVELVSERAEVHHVEHAPGCSATAAQNELEEICKADGLKITRYRYLLPDGVHGAILIGIVPPV